jgi:LacI family transcriptional regulator
MALLDRMIDGFSPPKQPEPVPVDDLIIRESSSVPEACKDIERARQFIHKNAHRALTVNEVLDQVAVSRPTFEKRFKQRFGCFPGQEIRQTRTNHLKQLLETSDLTVTAISALCGFSDVNKLNIFFKRETGMTPGKYRISQRNKL